MHPEYFFAPCPRGLEGVLADELARLHAREVRPVSGGVSFVGPFDLTYRANLHSRIASRVLWRLLVAPYRTETDVYERARTVPWETLFSPADTIKVTVNAQECPLKSLNFVGLRVKDAICDRFRTARGRRPSVETSRPDVRIEVFLDPQQCLIYLDTSGESLFKRGFRHSTVAAPLRENLAAGLLALAEWTPEEVLLDPMCGGGTLLIEAAQIAADVSPGLGRRFTFERLLNFDAARWRQMQAEARVRRRPVPSSILHGSDRDQSALDTTRANLEAAGLTDCVTLSQVDILDRHPPAEHGLLVMNPPYGVRLGEKEWLTEFYPRLGDALKQRFAGWRAYIFTADLRLAKLIGLAPSRRIPLFNGALESRLYAFKLVRGPARRLQRRET